MIGIDIRRHASPSISLIFCLSIIQFFSIHCIVHFAHIRITLNTTENLQTRTVRNQITDMETVAMSQTRRVEKPPVVVNGGGSIDNFVTSIIVNVCYCKLVVALSVSGIAVACSKSV